jgi:uncharacterized UBP type Zn finger protein
MIYLIYDHRLPLKPCIEKTVRNALTLLSVTALSSFRVFCSNDGSYQDDESGLNVCLSCFNGGCAGSRDHARLHFERFGHPLALNIRRTRKKIQVLSHHPAHDRCLTC